MRSIHVPDRWVMAVVTPEVGQPFRCIFGGWVGGYLGSDSWRRSTEIVSREYDGEYIHFRCASGSTYRCHRGTYGMTALVAAIITEVNDQHPHTITVLSPEDAMTEKMYTLRIPESLFTRLTNDAKLAESFPELDSEEYFEWYENRTSDGGNFDDCYNNGVSDGEALLSLELLAYVVPDE